MDLNLDDEDSLTRRFSGRAAASFDIAVIRLPHISNFTDFITFEQMDYVSVRYITDPGEIGDPDMIVIPGSKNTISDLEQIKKSGLCSAVLDKAREGTCIFGICGGFQMLGRRINDPYGVEDGKSAEGFGLLPVDTVLEKEKVQTAYSGRVVKATGVLADLEGSEAGGYEIHMGKTTPVEDMCEFTSGGTGYCRGNVYGTYVHGFFDKREIACGVIEKISKSRGKEIDVSGMSDYSDFKERQYEALAMGLRDSLDMDYIYGILGIGNDKE